MTQWINARERLPEEGQAIVFVRTIWGGKWLRGTWGAAVTLNYVGPVFTAAKIGIVKDSSVQWHADDHNCRLSLDEIAWWLSLEAPTSA